MRDTPSPVNYGICGALYGLSVAADTFMALFEYHIKLLVKKKLQRHAEILLKILEVNISGESLVPQTTMMSISRYCRLVYTDHIVNLCLLLM